MFNLFKKKSVKTLTNENVILEILDKAAKDFIFPMLDNGYYYSAAVRMTLYHCPDDWAVVIENFGFSPRAGYPDLNVLTIASSLRNKRTLSDYVNKEAFDRYLTNNKHTEAKNYFPIESGNWIDEKDGETVLSTGEIVLRGIKQQLPELSEYSSYGINTLGTKPYVFEYCRLLAEKNRTDILACPKEREYNIPEHLTEILVLDDWFHPDLANGQLPSQTETFIQLAKVLSKGDLSEYRPSKKTNTHWSNWPEAGLL